jgi:hypothetical protein
MLFYCYCLFKPTVYYSEIPISRFVVFLKLNVDVILKLSVTRNVQTDKKENRIFLFFKEIQMGAVAKSYMRKGSLIYEEMRKYLVIFKDAVSYDFATAPFWIS